MLSASAASPDGSPRSHPSRLAAVHEWLARQADALSEQTGVPRERLELSSGDIEALLEVAAHAAHESGARTNAPLLCYLLGISHTGAQGLAELVEAIRSTS